MKKGDSRKREERFRERKDQTRQREKCRVERVSEGQAEAAWRRKSGGGDQGKRPGGGETGPCPYCCCSICQL